MNAKKGVLYVLIRLKAATKEKLEKLREELLVLVEQGDPRAPEVCPEQINPTASSLSMDAVINYLLGLVYAKRERAKKSRDRRKAGEQ